MTMLTFLLISGLILSAVSQIGSMFQENSQVLFNFNCYENEDPEKVCSHYYNHKSCKIFLKFCIKSKPDIENPSNCDLFSKTFPINNSRGMCKKGKYDSRDYLKAKNTFNANLKRIFMYIKIEIETDGGDRSPYDTMDYINLTRGKHVIRMNTVKNIKERLINIKLNVRVNCLKNFNGNYCETYCFDVRNCSDEKKDTCTNDWDQMNCNSVNFTEKARDCNCIYSTGNFSGCSKDYKSCLDDLMKCQNTSQHNLSMCKRMMPKTYIYEIHYLAVGIGIGGLFFIVFILLIAVLIMWRRKNKILKKGYANDENCFEMERSSIKYNRSGSLSVSSVKSTEFHKRQYNDISSVKRPLPDTPNSLKSKSDLSKHQQSRYLSTQRNPDNAPPLPTRFSKASTSCGYDRIPTVETESTKNEIREPLEIDSSPIRIENQ